VEGVTVVVPPIVELARIATKSDWLVRDGFIKMLVNVIERSNPAIAHKFVIDFLSELYQDALHTIAVYELKQILERRGAKCIVVFLRNPLVDLVAVTPKNTYFIEVKSHGPPWRGNNIKEYLAYKRFPGQVIYAWKKGGTWMYARIEELILDVNSVRAIREHHLDELDI
jgi:Holliday junction resolvase